MELIDWIGLFFALTPVWAAIVYGVLRLTKRVPPPEGLPPGRVGGMGKPFGTAPSSDAPAYAQKLKREAEAEARKKAEGPAEG